MRPTCVMRTALAAWDAKIPLPIPPAVLAISSCPLIAAYLRKLLGFLAQAVKQGIDLLDLTNANLAGCQGLHSPRGKMAAMVTRLKMQ